MLVHAHPDDECIGTGATMAKYVADGVDVTLVTCTLGEEGEVLLPDLVHLAADQTDTLGMHRQTELDAAMAILGVKDHRLLGGAGRFRDSGMIGTPPNDRPDSFWRTDVLTAATELVAIIREVRPHVVVTYDEHGQYGHPDHIQAHRVTHYAIDLAEVASFRPDLGEAWRVSKIYWTAFPRSIVAAGIEALKSAGIENEFTELDPDEFEPLCDDDLVSTEIDGSRHFEQKMAALGAHGTQVNLEQGFFAFAHTVGARAFGIEYFRIARGTAVVDEGDTRERDLFAGLVP